jgi:hypothetical protein
MSNWHLLTISLVQGLALGIPIGHLVGYRRAKIYYFWRGFDRAELATIRAVLTGKDPLATIKEVRKEHGG